MYSTTAAIGCGLANAKGGMKGAASAMDSSEFRASRFAFDKMVSAAGVAPAIPRSQTGCVGCYATRCSTRHL